MERLRRVRPRHEERALPHYDEAERAILGAVLLDNQAFNTAAQILTPDDFFGEANRLIYEAMAALSERSESIDTVTVRVELTRRDALERAGGAAYICSLIDGIPAAANVEAYARIVREASRCSQLARLGQRLVDDALEPGSDPADLLARLHQGLKLVAAAGDPATPPGVTLREWLRAPEPPLDWRIPGWQPEGSRVIVSAQYKAGKTRLVANVARSLLDGADFLGTHPVAPISGSVALLDFEMGPRHLRAWLRDQRIENDDRLRVYALRGQCSRFNILESGIRAAWARELRESQVSYLVLDCLRPVLDALGLDEHHDAGRFLVAFDTLLVEAGVSDALLVHHMGHAGERSRGDSRLRDWPDVEWRLVRSGDDPAAPRYITAYGRDVDQRESALHFDPDTGRLTLTEGSRRDEPLRRCLEEVLAFLKLRDAPQSQRQVEAALGGNHTRKSIRAALALGKERGLIRVERGSRNSLLHRLVSECAGALAHSLGAVSVRRRTQPMSDGAWVKPMGVSRDQGPLEHVRLCRDSHAADVDGLRRSASVRREGWAVRLQRGYPEGLHQLAQEQARRPPVAHRRQGNNKSTPNTVAKDPVLRFSAPVSPATLGSLVAFGVRVFALVAEAQVQGASECPNVSSRPWS